MNYLAHLFLAGNDPEVIAGAFLEDFINGNVDNPKNDYLSRKHKVGIRLHRQIDTITDSHDEVKKCKVFFYEKFGKYSPIIVDVLFDHFLIKNWNSFSIEPFEDFRKRIYRDILITSDIHPEKMKKLVSSMIEHDWLKNYALDWGLEKAFLNLNAKIKNPEIDLTTSIEIMRENYEEINKHFLIFFQDLKDFCDSFLKENI